MSLDLVEVSILPTEWTEIGAGYRDIYINLAVKGKILVTFTDDATPPLIDAAAIGVNSYSANEFDFALNGKDAEQRVWVRSTAGKTTLISLLRST